MQVFSSPEQSDEEFIRAHEGEPMTPHMEMVISNHRVQNPLSRIGDPVDGHPATMEDIVGQMREIGRRVTEPGRTPVVAPDHLGALAAFNREVNGIQDNDVPHAIEQGQRLTQQQESTLGGVTLGLNANTITSWELNTEALSALGLAEAGCKKDKVKDDGEIVIVPIKDDIKVIIDNRNGMMLAYFDVLVDIALRNNISIAFINSRERNVSQTFSGITIFNDLSRISCDCKTKKLPKDGYIRFRFNNVAYELLIDQVELKSWDIWDGQVFIKDNSKSKPQVRGINPGEELPVECLSSAGIVGEIDKGEIYLFFNIAQRGTTDSVAFFKAVVSRGIVLMKKHGYLLSEFTQQSFSQFCNNDVKCMLKKKAQELRKRRHHKECAEMEYLASLEKFNEVIFEIKSINKDTIKRGIVKQYAQLESLLREGTYDKFEFKDGYIVGYTNEVKIEHEEKTYYIGKFEIRLPSDGNRINMINLTNKKGEQHHPQVYSDSARPCLGNISVAAYKLLANEQYGILFELLYQFLCSYNENSCLCKIGLWSKNKKEAKKAERSSLHMEAEDVSEGRPERAPEGFLVSDEAGPTPNPNLLYVSGGSNLGGLTAVTTNSVTGGSF